MMEILEKLIPNVIDYSDKFWSGCIATLQMFFISGIFSFILGIVLGVIGIVWAVISLLGLAA